MKHSLQLKLSQHLTLTPQLQQSIRLLQLSTIELNQELERYLAENPLLERADAHGNRRRARAGRQRREEGLVDFLPERKQRRRDPGARLVERGAFDEPPRGNRRIEQALLQRWSKGSWKSFGGLWGYRAG